MYIFISKITIRFYVYVQCRLCKFVHVTCVVLWLCIHAGQRSMLIIRQKGAANTFEEAVQGWDEVCGCAYVREGCKWGSLNEGILLLPGYWRELFHHSRLPPPLPHEQPAPVNEHVLFLYPHFYMHSHIGQQSHTDYWNGYFSCNRHCRVLFGFASVKARG